MTTAIIVAAGKGTRMGPNVDKLFLDIAGRPVVAHTWQRFDDANCIQEIILVVRDGMQSAFQDLAKGLALKKPFRLVAGGAERQDSVWNGLHAVSDATEIVAIQDGARPCTSLALIEATVEAARECGAAVAAQPVTDTIKESANGKVIDRTLDRSKLWAVQTPQAFHLEIIHRGLAEVKKRGMHVTDDTAACELIGQKVHLISSIQPNPKITTPEDIAYAALLLQREGMTTQAPRLRR
ncbi:MAG TPA: 2-C-methyl-D-erythritol 4-phosphate cytidylyltransferase [Verrucomicrobia bacterium]|nr:2-C-methyl-D-erythritol 4-phosphate cytidylyltransferase [Verrucomicrobiota bacterium]HPU56149.1 2-C-methyl-D-erythritol 4-phosphate cytidylyltransferase [Verrucomicrobiota bacterium]